MSDATLKINYIVPHTVVSIAIDGETYAPAAEYLEYAVTPGVTKVKVENTFGKDSASFYWYLWNEAGNKCHIISKNEDARKCIFTIPEGVTGEEELDIDVFDFTYDRRWFFKGNWELTVREFEVCV